MKVIKKRKTPVFLLLAVFPVILCLFSCQNKPASDTAFVVDKDISYAFGMYLAEQWRAPIRIQYDYKAFMEGFRDFNEQQETRLSRDEVYEKIQAFIDQVSAEVGKAGKAEEDEYLAANAGRPGVIVTASGLQYEILSEGTGPKPGPYDMVQVHYQGSLLDGTVFASSYDRGEPALFILDMLISGWKEGIQLMNTGSVYRFYVPSELGYGAQGAGDGAIPPNATLIFQVELLGVEAQ